MCSSHWCPGLVCRMAGLQDLTLACCKLSSAGVAACSSLQGLTSLDLVGCVDGVTPEAAAALSKVSPSVGPYAVPVCRLKLASLFATSSADLISMVLAVIAMQQPTEDLRVLSDFAPA